MKITILGNGAFGSALTTYLKKIGHEVFIDVIKNSEVIFICVPCHAVVEVLLKRKKEITNQKIIICSKGFAGNGKLVSEALDDEFKNDIFFLSGPILADELRNGKFSSIVLAGNGNKNILKKELESETLYVEICDDVIGAEISAALKNVITIFVGIAEGSGCGQNAIAFIFTRGVQEIKNIGVALGAQRDTFLGLSCIGDLSLFSRNRFFGVELGKGKRADKIMEEMDYTPEGIFALKNAKIMIDKLNINAPIINLLYKIIFENLPISKAMEEIKKL